MRVRYIIAVFTCVLCLTAPDQGRAQPVKDAPIVTLKDEWRAKRGDSPVDTKGQLIWLREDLSDGWMDVATFGETPQDQVHEFFWLRLRVPDGSWRNPVLFLPPVLLAFEVYLDTTLIYRYAEFTPSDDLKFSSTVQHIVPLPDDASGRILSCRIYSPNPKFIGITDQPVYTSQPALIGELRDVMLSIFYGNIDSVLLGGLFILSGLFSIAVFLRRYKQSMWFLLSFGWLAYSIGLFYVLQDATTSLLIDAPVLQYYAGMVAYITFPVGMYAFLEQITESHRVIRRLWQLHLAYAVILIPLDLWNLVLIPESLGYYSMAFIISISIAFVVGTRAAVKGSREARIFSVGFMVFGVAGIHDLLAGMGFIPLFHWLSQWGMLAFLICLAYILEQRFADNRRRLEIYAEELEQKSNELADYNRTLEQRVDERTKDLAEKNTALELTLHQLEEAQHHLIMQEKMASLGNLVAGVAHEVNTPIGAVNSAVDVEARCIERIHKAIAGCDTTAGLLDNPGFAKASKLLSESNRVIVTAGQRIAKIVQTLKNFARLDEAELQESHIHESLESTLTLVYHELKNKVEVVREYGEIPRIKCFPNQLNQVFMNLFINAAQAIEEHGTITIHTSVEAGYVSIRISDDGKGIPSDNLEKIFDPGFTTKGVGVGTGLGLSICYKIIEDHGGKIQAESETGKGTAFTIALPVS